MIFKGLINRDCLIRRQILGGRINFSARTVIVPNAKLKAYQIELPYVAFVEMFKKHAIFSYPNGVYVRSKAAGTSLGFCKYSH